MTSPWTGRGSLGLLDGIILDLYTEVMASIMDEKLSRCG